jgi:UDP-N-acetylglucosamine--N-acetylmuramyl-(pentapeptide) pyrophosphoryl-undecaprenol N-acetylglucosamine transferase
MANARHFARAGAGVVIAERDLTPASLAAALSSCLGDAERLASMAQAARGIAHADAAERLADACVAAAEARA